MKKQIIFVACILLCALCLSACSESATFESYVKNGDYAKAIMYYNTKISGNMKSELAASSFMASYLAEQFSDCTSGKLSDENFQAAVNTVSSVCNGCYIVSTGELDTVQEQCEELSDSRSAYEQGVQSLQAANYPSAIGFFQNVSVVDTLHYQDAQSQMQEASEAYKEQIKEKFNQIIDEAIAQESDTLLTEAGDLIATAAIYLDTSDVDALYREYYNTLYPRVFDYHYEKQDYEMAIRAYNNGESEHYVTWSADIIQKVAECKTAYRTDIITQAKAAYETDGYGSALSIIAEGLSVMPDDKTLTEYDAQFRSCIPVALNELSLLEGDDNFRGDSVEDIYGNSYDNGYFDFVRTFGNDTESSATYYLGGAYTTFSGTYFGPSYISEDVTVQFKVIADDVLIYDSGAFKRDQKAVNFSIDVTNVERLTIISSGSGTCHDGWGFTFYPKAALTDAYVSNELALDTF